MNRSNLYTRLVPLLMAMLLIPISAMRAPDDELARLRPDSPVKYLETGERLAALAGSPEEQQLASQVLAMGLGLAHRAGDGQLAAGMCIALAASETDPDRARSLWDLALLLDPSRHTAWAEHRQRRDAEARQLRAQAARLLYFLRNSDAREASALYNRAEVRRLLSAAAGEEGVDPDRLEQTMQSMLAHAQDDDCRGRVFIMRAVDGRPQRSLCPDHARPIGAGPDDEVLRDLITLELALLAPQGDTAGLEDWATLGYIDRTGPARDPSVSEMLYHYEVDLSRSYRRGGAWSARP